MCVLRCNGAIKPENTEYFMNPQILRSTFIFKKLVIINLKLENFSIGHFKWEVYIEH